MFEYIKCPNCKRKIKAILKENRWVKWIEIYCSDCGYRKNIHDKEFDYIQPSSPFFKAIYGHDPMELKMRQSREEKKKKENLLEEREKRLKEKVYQGLLKSYELEDIKKYVKESGLE